MPSPRRKSPLKSVCHISLQRYFSNRQKAVLFRLFSWEIIPCRVKILLQVFALALLLLYIPVKGVAASHVFFHFAVQAVE